MKNVLRSLVFAAAGFAAASLYQQWASNRRASSPRHRHPLENWENEGGALPDVATADGGPASRRRESLTPL